MVMGEAEIGFILANLPPITQVGVVDFWFYLFLLVLLKKFMVMKEVIIAVTAKEVYLGLNIPVTLPFKIMDKVFMVTVEVDIDLISATIPPITQVVSVYFWVSMLMVVI